MLTTTWLKARPAISLPRPASSDSRMRRSASAMASSGAVTKESGMGMVLDQVDVVFAQRMADPVVGEQDTTQVGMTLEADAHHVPGLALVPAGGRPDVGDRGGGRIGARHLDVELEIGVGSERIQVVDAFEAAHVVDCGDEVARLV